MTEKALSCRVHGLHQADFVDGDDRVNCGVKDRGAPAAFAREKSQLSGGPLNIIFGHELSSIASSDHLVRRTIGFQMIPEKGFRTRHN